jgi:hypothetical protein
MRLRVVRDRDGLVARQRTDEDVRAELLDEPLGLLDRGVGAVVRAAETDDLERVAADNTADGLFGFFRWPPANCANAASAPPMSVS